MHGRDVPSAFGVQRSAFSVQRSAFGVRRRSQDIGNTFGSGHFSWRRAGALNVKHRTLNAETPNTGL